MKYEITTDPVLLEQYYRIRERCFRRELGLESFDGSEDAWDRRSHILVARIGDRCVGGTRITGRHPCTPNPLPLEEAGCDLADALSGMDLAGVAFCQWSRLALEPEYRTTEMLRGYCSAMIDASRALGYSFNLVVAGMNRTRLYKRLYSLLGFRYEIARGVRIPAEPGFDGLPHLLAVGYLDGGCCAQAAHSPLRAVA